MQLAGRGANEENRAPKYPPSPERKVFPPLLRRGRRTTPAYDVHYLSIGKITNVTRVTPLNGIISLIVFFFFKFLAHGMQIFCMKRTKFSCLCRREIMKHELKSPGNNT